MSRRRSLSLFTLALVAWIFVVQVSARQTCGTSNAVRRHQEIQKNLARKPLARETSTCTSVDYYDSVFTQKTEHFQIFYTLSGPHQTTPEFIDTLAKDAEFAYQFHTSQMGLLPPMGTEYSFHYQKKVDQGLYPIEVIDVDLLRATEIYLGGICHGCFGVTISEDYSEGKTTLVIDNDFRYTPSGTGVKDTVSYNEKNCSYKIADQELKNEAHGYSYADQWENAIRVTTIHELYHAVQLRYLDLTNYWTFWFEASASGVEDAAAPELDDYFAYLPTMSKAVGTPLDEMIEDYGAGIFFLYLYNHVSPKTDKFIWESFSKEPGSSFWDILHKYSQKQALSIDSLFQDFSTVLSFAGSRSNHLDTSRWISSDQNRWPDFKLTRHETSAESFTPQVKQYSYQFHKEGRPNLSSFKGQATAIAFKSQEPEIRSIKTTNDVDSLYNAWNLNSSVDSIIWVFSKIHENTIPSVIKDSTFRVYPNPWRGGNLCFTPLPQNKKFIEIRNRRGDLITRKKYNAQTLCIEEHQVKKLMVPGVYRYRAGSSGKTKDFIVIY